MTDVDGALRLGFTAAGWIAPGDEISFEPATGAVRISRGEHAAGSDTARVLRLVRDELDVLAGRAGDAPEGARLLTAAAGLTLVLAWLEPARPAPAEDDAAAAEAPRAGGDAGPPASAPAAPDPAPGPPQKAPAGAKRPRRMPSPEEPGVCESCGKTIPGNEAELSWTRWRKVLCMDLADGKPSPESCYAKQGRQKATPPAQAEPLPDDGGADHGDDE